MTYPLQTTLLFLLLIFSIPGWANTPVLTASAEISTAGYFQLDWQGSSDSPFFQLEESTSADFTSSKLLYEGQDTSSVISGRGNGEYLYRLREIDTQSQSAGQWSEPVRVSVEHHALTKALSFFFIGLLVFISTLVAIMRGSKRLSHQG